jgi:nitric oxide reductase subunit B
MSAYLLMAVGLVSRKLAERAVYFELILIFLGGVIGTGHHLYWAGGPSLWVPMGSMFSFVEVLPLVLLIIEAIGHYRLITAHQSFNYTLAYTYIIGAAFWNFVGAGVFGGGTLNAPLVNYYEHGTFLTLNHAHTALFGAFGLLAIGLIYFCLRYAAGGRVVFNERLGWWAFWLCNIGLVLWILLNFFPIGWPQLDAVFEHGLAYARSVKFYDETLLWQWMQFPGDVVFAVAALLMAWDFLIKLGPFYPEFVVWITRRPVALSACNRKNEVCLDRIRPDGGTSGAFAGAHLCSDPNRLHDLRSSDSARKGRARVVLKSNKDIEASFLRVPYGLLPATEHRLRRKHFARSETLFVC